MAFEKLRAFLFRKESRALNSVILFLLALCISLFIAAICEKWTIDDDDITDLLKILLVTMNVVIFVIITIQKRDVVRRVRNITFVLTAFLLTLSGGIILDYYIMAIRFENDDDFQPLDFNADFLVLALTMLTDVLYLSLYIFFNHKRVLLITVGLIILEIVVFGVSFTVGSDDIIDTVNISTSMVTAIMSMIFWSGLLTVEGSNVIFYDFYERLDLLGDEKQSSVEME